MLGIFRQQREAGNLDSNLTQVFRGTWNPTEPRNGTAASWGKENKDQSIGPEVCWESEPGNSPLTLTEMTESEREVSRLTTILKSCTHSFQLFSASVNSPLKAPANKDSTPSTGNRKTSISQTTPYGASPHSSRPGPRRRETVDSSTGSNPLSPSGSSRFFRDEPHTSTPPAALIRRKTDLKDSPTEPKSATKDKDEGGRDTAGETSSPFDSFRRRPTGGPVSAGLSAPESPWSAAPRSATFGGGMGAFGSFSLGAGNGSSETPEKDKRSAFGSMPRESRFKGLLSKASSEDIASGSTPEKSVKGNLERLTEDEPTEGNSGRDASKARQARSGTNHYDDDASLGGSTGFDADPRSQVTSEVGFSAFGDTIRHMVGSHQTPQSRQYGHDAASPANTNPYQSPEGDIGAHGDDGQAPLEGRRTNLSALGSLREDSSADTFGSLRGKNVSTGFDDRSQTSSTGPGRGFSAFGGIGFPNVGGPSPWSANPIAPIGTPTKDRSGYPGPFGDSMFGSMADLQSPNIASGFGTFGRSSKMGPLFPPAMQDQLRDERDRPGSVGEAFKQEVDFNRTDQSHDMARGGSNESSTHDSAFNHQQSSGFAQGSTPGSGAMANVGPVESHHQQSQSSEGSNQLPTSQQRQMVMPDRMRWIYRDPQGHTQGPWSGLEMHDWFKAGFFTAELQVRKVEDPDFEPLAQLVRRIGNSREPFLVPQIGVPHGPTPQTQANPWVSGASVSGGVPQGSGAQPPFANNFPSFGTTLTAEQQNALERRKQEEQYLMARQKEHLAHQQAMMKQMAMPGTQGFQHGLQHHSSAHSLHSQPSFGSITSPSGYQPSPIQGPSQLPPPMAGFPEPTRPLPQAGLGRGDLDELPAFFERMNVNRGAQHPFGPGPFGGRAPEGSHQQAIGTMLQDRARIQAEQQDHLKLTGDILPDFQNDGRLREFNQLIGQPDDLSAAGAGHGPSSIPIGGTRPRHDDVSKRAQEHESAVVSTEKEDSPEPEMLSLSKQAKDVAASQQQVPESVWQTNAEFSQPIIPPPQPASPLPAPAAQRRQNVADTLVAESRSQTQTPVETPSASIAPWADKTAELPKGPSLREIQEAEAKKAAEREELAAQARRAQAELERQQAANVPAPAPGLPSSSTWANTTGPATPTGTSVWAKNPPAKAIVATPSGTKKTLAQIQKEEEMRKQRQVTSAAVTPAASNNANVSGGKRYAELAGKAAAATPTGAVANSGAWTTVGSGGKVKAPATVVAAPGLVQRKPSGIVIPQATTRPIPTRAASNVIAAPSAQASKAQEEFVKWAKGQLSKGLSSGINGKRSRPQ